MPAENSLATRVQFDQLRIYAETHRHDAYLESAIVLLVATLMSTWVPWQGPVLWSAACLPCLLLAHGLFARFLATEPDPALYRPWVMRIAVPRAILTLLWASIPVWGWLDGVLLNNALILLLQIGHLGVTAARSTAHRRLYLVDTVPVAVALLLTPLLGSAGGSVPYSLLSIAFIAYLVLPAVATNDTTAKLLRAQIEKDALIAELAAARNAAQRASIAKTNFLASMSHELRTPLNGMLGVAQLLQNRPVSGEDAHLLRILHEAGQGLVCLVNDLLDLSNVESGRVRIGRHPFSPRVLLETVTGILQPAATAKGLALVADAATVLPDRLLGDESRLRQVLLNLAGNAIKFTDRGSVTLSLDWADGVLETLVQDTGPGIDPDRLRALERGDITPNRARGGAGLGLSISRGLARAMGGSLQIESRPGAGVIARLLVPAALPPDPAPSPDDTPGHTPPAVDPLTVLVVEDVHVNRFILEKMLEHLGHQCLLAETAEEALALLRHERVDLVLMDVRLPGMGGVEATRRLRTVIQPHQKPVPVVAMTANLFPDDLAIYQAAGMTEILPKPIELPVLVALLDRVAGQKSPRPAGRPTAAAGGDPGDGGT